MVISVGTDVSKDKHDCFIASSEGEILADVFTIPNNIDGFRCLLKQIQNCSNTRDKIKVGLEATGHYSYNLLGFLLDNGLSTYVLNPLRTNIYRKSLSLRKTKTDRVDARTIVSMLLSDVGLKPYTDTAYHNEELKSLTRYRFDKVKERSKLKSSIARLICILFPELEKLVPSLHMASIYALLLALGCLPNLLNYSIPSVSSVNWITKFQKSKNKSNPSWMNLIHQLPRFPDWVSVWLP